MSALLDRLTVLVDVMRRAGVPVTTAGHLDAVAALAELPLGDVGVVREALRATLVKQPDPEGLFDRAFATVMLRPPAVVAADAPSAASPVGDVGELTARLQDAVRGGARDELAALAGPAVAAFGGFDVADRTARYHLHRVTRALDLSRMLGTAMRQLRADGEVDEFELALKRIELLGVLDELRRLLAAEVAAKMAAEGDPLAPVGDRGDLRDRDIVTLSATELDELRRVVQPLARALARRASRRRHARREGRLDVRRTVRRSLGAGGVPLDVALRHRPPHRPDVVLLCDVSGSVAEFARFTLLLVGALHAELRSVRSFAFVDGIAEVTELFRHAVYQLNVRRLAELPGIVAADGHSDYGRVFGAFADRHLTAVTPRSTVIVCGDARTNHRPANEGALRRVAERARRVWWFNPEPAAEWGATDSMIETYRPACSGVFEVRTLRQLADAVGHLLA